MLKIAVASTDGKVINAHFGRTSQFLIFELKEDGMEYIEKRTNAPGCGQLNHPLGTMEDTIKLISDCSLVLVAQIGPTMIERLQEMGITAMRKPQMIEDALNEIEAEWRKLE